MKKQTIVHLIQLVFEQNEGAKLHIDQILSGVRSLNPNFTTSNNQYKAICGALSQMKKKGLVRSGAYSGEYLPTDNLTSRL